jgi:hypothetical protein
VFSPTAVAQNHEIVSPPYAGYPAKYPAYPAKYPGYPPVAAMYMGTLQMYMETFQMYMGDISNVHGNHFTDKFETVQDTLQNIQRTL